MFYLCEVSAEERNITLVPEVFRANSEYRHHHHRMSDHVSMTPLVQENILPFLYIEQEVHICSRNLLVKQDIFCKKYSKIAIASRS